MQNDEKEVSTIPTVQIEPFIKNVSLKSSMNARDHSREQMIILKVQYNNTQYYIIYKKLEVPMGDENKTDITSKFLAPPTSIFGIQIYIAKTLDNLNQFINYVKIKDVVEKAFRLLVLAYHSSYNELSEENQLLYNESDFITLQSFLLKLGIGNEIDFVSYYNTSIKQSDPIQFQKQLPSIFDNTEKSTFIPTGTEKIDLKSSLDDFILMIDKTKLSIDKLEKLQDYLKQQMMLQKMSFNDFTQFLNPSPSI